MMMDRGDMSSDHFMIDESTIDYLLKEDNSGSSSSMTRKGLLHDQSSSSVLIIDHRNGGDHVNDKLS